MTAFLIEVLLYCIVLAIVLTIFKLVGIYSSAWAFIVVLLLVPAMIGIFVLAVVLVHDALATPEDKESARQRRHHRNFGL